MRCKECNGTDVDSVDPANWLWDDIPSVFCHWCDLVVEDADEQEQEKEQEKT